MHALAEAIAPPYGTLIRFAAYTGLRAGEIGALRVKQIDFRRGRVEVAESVSDVAGRLVGPTKTYANRHVPMPPLLLHELAAYLGARCENREELVFRARRGDSSGTAPSTAASSSRRSGRRPTRGLEVP